MCFSSLYPSILRKKKVQANLFENFHLNENFLSEILRYTDINTSSYRGVGYRDHHMSELYPYVGITDIKGGRKMEKCVRNISHYGDRSCSSFIKKQIIFPLDVNSSLHSVNIYQSSDVLLWIRNCVWS